VKVVAVIAAIAVTVATAVTEVIAETEVIAAVGVRATMAAAAAVGVEASRFAVNETNGCPAESSVPSGNFHVQGRAVPARGDDASAEPVTPVQSRPAGALPILRSHPTGCFRASCIEN
jgi:hypothetical protein